MKKWLPIYGMFTKDADKIPEDSELNYIMCFYHGAFIAIIICKIFFS